MRIGIIGAGHIGGNIARFLAGAGHEVTVTF
jgi:Trk K+ transport system NAD-binding subunit